MSLPGIYVQSVWGEQLRYQKTKAYRPYVVEVCQGRAKLPSRKAGLKWPRYAEKIAVPQKWGLHTMYIFLAYGNERYNRLPEVDLQNPWPQAASLPMRSCGTFGLFLVRTFWPFDTYQLCYIVILNRVWLTSNSVLVPHSLHRRTRYTSNA